MKNGYFHIEIMISAAHMLEPRGHAPQRENLENMCNLVYILIRFCIKVFFK